MWACLGVAIAVIGTRLGRRCVVLSVSIFDSDGSMGAVLRCDTDAQSAGFLEGQVVRDFDLYITFGGDSFTKSTIIVIQDVAYLC